MNDTDDWYYTEPVSGAIDAVSQAIARAESRAFVVEGTEDTVLVDTGRGIGDLRAYLGESGVNPDRVVLTHSHWDHVGNAHQFDDVAINDAERNTDGSLTLDVVSEVFLQRPRQFIDNHLAAGRELPDSVDPETFDIPAVDHVDAHTPGDVIDLGDRHLEAVDIAGHTGGQTGFLSRADGVLLGADLVHIDRNVYAHFDDSSVDDYVDSLERAIDLRDAGAYDVLATAHNNPMSGEDLDLLDDLLAGLESIRDGTEPTARVETKWGPAKEYEFGDTLVRVPAD
jgi:glyoxylase-like metal-dependent hydrolase (beta-lactamase superfamily II)